MEPRKIVEKIHELNSQHVGWNLYDTEEGPQPNLRGRVTYTFDAFWKEKVDESVIRELLSLLRQSANDFCVVFDHEHNKFAIYQLPPVFIGSKVLMQRIKGAQLDDEGLRLLQEEVSSEKNMARVENYKEAEVETSENLYGPEIKYKDGKKTPIKISTKTLIATEQVPVMPFYH